MIRDDRTSHFDLPLPYGSNRLQDDVLRLRNALTAIDAEMFDAQSKIELPVYLADGTYSPILLSRHDG